MRYLVHKSRCHGLYNATTSAPPATANKKLFPGAIPVGAATLLELDVDDALVEEAAVVLLPPPVAPEVVFPVAEAAPVVTDPVAVAAVALPVI